MNLRKRKGGPNDDAPPADDEVSSSSSQINGSTSRHQPNKNQQQGSPLMLLICASGICGCYLYFGIVQERVFAKGSSSKVIQEVGSITTFMLVLSCITNVLVAKIWLVISNKFYGTTHTHKRINSDENIQTKNGIYIAKDEITPLPLNHMCLLANAFTYFAAMTASNEALTYVSYPTAVLAKSSKLIPTMLVGFFFERKSFLIQEWCSAALITAGITIFNFSRLSTNNEASAGAVVGEEEDNDSIFGIFLLLFSLAMDGLLASFQGRLKHDQNGKYRLPSALDCMLWVNAYAIIFMLPLSIWTGQFSNGIKLFRNSQIVPVAVVEPLSSLRGGPKIVGIGRVILNLIRRGKKDAITITSTAPNESLALAWTILWLNMTAAAGQIFIFFTIQLFSPLMCTTITTTRKFITILLSVLNFGHHFTRVQWSAIVMVFGGLYLAIVSKVSNTKKPIKEVKRKED